MFSGIVETTAEVAAVSRQTITLSVHFESPCGRGDSICVDGVCLTVRDVPREDIYVFDVSSETLSRTTLGRLRSGSVVNVERALKVGDRLGGHFVTGHVDGVGRIERLEPGILAVKVPRGLSDGIVEKGSVAVDGISLTVASVRGDSFEVALVPHTYLSTTLRLRRKGDPVNVEIDVLYRYVKAALAHGKEDGLLWNKLAAEGFVV